MVSSQAPAQLAQLCEFHRPAFSLALAMRFSHTVPFDPEEFLRPVHQSDLVDRPPKKLGKGDGDLSWISRNYDKTHITQFSVVFFDDLD